MREVVAFSNCGGGKLIVGVDDDGSIVGLKDAVEEEFALLQAIEQFCKPQPLFTLHNIALNKKRSVLIFDIKESPQKPMFVIYNTKRQLGRAYFRVADQSIQASRELRRILKIRQTNQNQGFSYGPSEQLLMSYFRENEHITLEIFSEIAHISEQEASDILIQLTSTNVLRIHPSDKQDQYSLRAY